MDEMRSRNYHQVWATPKVGRPIEVHHDSYQLEKKEEDKELLP